MVYNRRHPTEQYRISLKLTSGALRTFFLSPGSKNAYPFWTLEDKITSFLQVQVCMIRYCIFLSFRFPNFECVCFPKSSYFEVQVCDMPNFHMIRVGMCVYFWQQRL